LGKVASARARLVKALVDEGLFDRNRGLSVPRPAMTIGLVASPGTEGFRDFMGCLEASGLAFDVRVVPTHVQGRRASASVATALHRFDTEPIDLLVVVRGGGSKADLATFDSEPVARAVASSERPVWTGIGHTGDLSVADEVANRSFITPTECGQELVTQAVDFWRSAIDAGRAAARIGRQAMVDADRELDHRRRSAASCARSHLDRHRDRLVHRATGLRSAVGRHLDQHQRQVQMNAADLARSSLRALDSGHEEIAVRSDRLAMLSTGRIEVEDVRLDNRRRLLDAYDYRRLLERGYSVTRDATGAVVRSTGDVEPGSLLFTRLTDGELTSTVTAATQSTQTAPGQDRERANQQEDER
jgi:exodeoxyribonuclease VII large subunit